MSTLRRKWMVLGAGLLLTGAVQAQGQGEMQRLRLGDPGRWDYQNSCASCHGVAGKGDGPVVRYLVSQPTDLTQMAKRNGGVFPKDRVAAMIDGRGTPDIGPHGTREMPIWGSTFADRMKQSGGSDAQAEHSAQRRIDDLVDHLLRMQQK